MYTKTVTHSIISASTTNLAYIMYYLIKHTFCPQELSSLFWRHLEACKRRTFNLIFGEISRLNFLFRLWLLSAFPFRISIWKLQIVPIFNFWCIQKYQKSPICTDFQNNLKNQISSWQKDFDFENRIKSKSYQIF